MRILYVYLISYNVFLYLLPQVWGALLHGAVRGPLRLAPLRAGALCPPPHRGGAQSIIIIVIIILIIIVVVVVDVRSVLQPFVRLHIEEARNHVVAVVVVAVL